MYGSFKHQIQRYEARTHIEKIRQHAYRQYFIIFKLSSTLTFSDNFRNILPSNNVTLFDLFSMLWSGVFVILCLNYTFTMIVQCIYFSHRIFTCISPVSEYFLIVNVIDTVSLPSTYTIRY